MTEQIKIIESAKIFLQHTDGSILLLRRSLHDTHRPGEWDLPGGELLEGEKPLDAILRETPEETGLAIISCDIERAYYTHLSHSRYGHTNKRHFFCASVAINDLLLSDEHCESRLVVEPEALGLLGHPIQRQALRYMIGHNILRVAELAS